MIGFEYGNTRLRARKARLLSGQEIRGLAGSRDYQDLIGVLVETAYREPLESVLVRTSGRKALMDALHEDLINSLGKIRDFYGEDIESYIMLALRQYDLHNIKAVLRGLENEVPGGEIVRSLLPVGRLSRAELRELAQASSPRNAIDRMATMRLPLVQPLIDLRAQRPGASLFEMEVALERWHQEDARARLEKSPGQVSLLSESLKIDADIFNMLIVLRFVVAPGEREILKQIYAEAGIEPLLVGPGMLSWDKLVTAGEQARLERAVQVLSKVPYKKALQRGLRRVQQTGRLSDIEEQLLRFRLEWRSKLALKDPLGIGVLLSYLALKINEVQNIRRVIAGIDAGLDPEDVLETLMVVQ